MIFCVFICLWFDWFWSHHDIKNPVISCEVPIGVIAGGQPVKGMQIFLRRRRQGEVPVLAPTMLVVSWHCVIWATLSDEQMSNG